MIKKIGVLTSGGDAPGMNAAIRGVVRSALTEGLEVMGIYDGYLGLYEDRMVQLDRYSVSDMINRGGTFLGSARFPEFRDENIRAVAIENLKKRGIDALHGCNASDRNGLPVHRPAGHYRQRHQRH